MTRNCIAIPVAFALVVLAAGCQKVNDPSTQVSHGRNRDSASASNFNFHFVEEWVQAASPWGAIRTFAFAFTIGSKGYMGGGEGYLPNARGVNPNYIGTLGDFWQYDPSTNTWTQEANQLFELERTATFVVGAQGYIGTGFHAVYNPTTGWNVGCTNRLYQYDQASNTWTRKADLPANARCDAVGAGAQNEGYIGTGNDLNTPFYSDWWQYDPPTDHWTQKTSMPGQWGRAEASSFSIGPYPFVTCGSIFAVGPAFANDCWRYDPSLNSWLQESSLPASGRYYATGFSYGTYGAVTCGLGGNGMLNDFWYFDVGTNTWKSDLSMSGGARYAAVGFSINGIPYVGTGTTANNYYNNDFWYLTYVLL
jgi:N-acetylneuraminic acid mutarotase